MLVGGIDHGLELRRVGKLDCAEQADARSDLGDGGMVGQRAEGVREHRLELFHALDEPLPDLKEPTKAALEKAMAGHVLGQAELIGLAPRAAFDGFPDDVPLRGFSAERHILEEALEALG